MKNIFLKVSILLSLFACEIEATNVVPPEAKSKLVLYSFISPQDDFITVKLSKSNPIFGTQQNFDGEFNNVVDAVVTITNGSQTSHINYDLNNFEYRLPSLSFPILPNQTYTLTAVASDGETISASCKIPAGFISDITTEIQETYDNGSTYNKLSLKFEDFGGVENYYRAYAQYLIVDTLSLDTNYLDTYSHPMTSDYNRDGELVILVNDNLSLLNSDQYFYNNSVLKNYDVYVMNIDINYYLFQTSIDKYTYDDPFSEPSPLYTNVNGGLGVFAGYQKTKLVVD